MAKFVNNLFQIKILQNILIIEYVVPTSTTATPSRKTDLIIAIFNEKSGRRSQAGPKGRQQEVGPGGS